MLEKFLPKRRLKKAEDTQGPESHDPTQGFQGVQSPLHETSTSILEGIAAWAQADGKPATYVPIKSQSKVASLSQVAQALNAELGASLGLGPSPFGTVESQSQGPSMKEAIQNPNVQPFAYETPQGEKQVVLNMNSGHSYFAQGQINEQEVTFIVDTGASQVSIPHRVASYLGLKAYGRPSYANTANGRVEVYSVVLDSVQIGNIVLRKVSGLINTGDDSDHVLLGMTALKHLDVRVRDNRLILIQSPK